MKKKKYFTGDFKDFAHTEQLSKMRISSQVFFKNIVYRFKTTYLKNGFFEGSLQIFVH